VVRPLGGTADKILLLNSRQTDHGFLLVVTACFLAICNRLEVIKRLTYVNHEGVRHPWWPKYELIECAGFDFDRIKDFCSALNTA
jgi:hypothetical protein